LEFRFACCGVNLKKSGCARNVEHAHIANKGKLIVGATQGNVKREAEWFLPW